MDRNEPNRRLKAAIGNHGGGHNQLPPQKCPRCESMNTKFCYYNNYSLSQPRYFCKSCRRYWTQGGTLRNVPVGGSSRRGKRLKTSAAAPPPPAENFRPPQLHSASNFDSNKEMNPNLMNSSSIVSLYPPGGFLSSLAAIQNLSNTSTAPPQLPPVNQLNFGGIQSPNLSILNGFNGAGAFGSNQQRQFYSASNQNWQPFSSNINTSAANSSTATASASVGSFPMNPNENQWNDLPNFGDCPP